MIYIEDGPRRFLLGEPSDVDSRVFNSLGYVTSNYVSVRRTGTPALPTTEYPSVVFLCMKKNHYVVGKKAIGHKNLYRFIGTLTGPTALEYELEVLNRAATT